MPPRLELMIMRTLQISYVEARDLVQEGRTALNMKFTDPWDDTLREQCELIHKKRGGSIVKQQQQQDEKGDEQGTVTATAAATCSSSTIHDDTNNEDEKVDTSASNNKENTTVKNKNSNSNSNSNKSSSTDDDDDDDDESDSLSMTREELMKRQSPSKASLYNTLGDSLWVVQSSNDHLSASNHSDDDEDNLNSKDNDDDEKLLHQTITIKTKPKTLQQQSQHSNYSGSCRDIKNNPKVTTPQNTIPKFVYVITLNDVPIELLLEEAKRKSIHLRGSHSNDDKNTNEGRRSRSRSVGRKNNTNNNASTKKDSGSANNMFRRGRSLSRHRKNSAGDGADTEQCTDECTGTPKSSSTKSSNSSGNVDRPQRRRSLSRGKKMIMDKLQSFRKNTNTTKNGAPVIDIDIDLDDDDDDDDEKQ